MSDAFSSLESPRLSMRDVAAPVLRHPSAVVATLALVLIAAAAAAWFMPAQYESEMTLLMQHERVDPLVSSDSPSRVGDPGASVSESELMSEAELLKSGDVLEQVVLDTGLHNPAQYETPAQEAAARAGSIARLRSKLHVMPVRRTMLIRVSYASPDPGLSQRVLARLAQVYLDKHLAVHRPAGTREFFGEQVERARTGLQSAQARLTAFGEGEHVVAAGEERDESLKQAASFEALLQQARAEAADAARRLSAVEQQLTVVPDRQVTSIRTGVNGTMVAQLKSRVLEMELQRDELLRKFTPAYPPVVQLESQIARTRQALEAAERAPILDETTDQNPTSQWLRNEAARIRTERDALTARVESLTKTVAQYRDRARRLDQQSIEQQTLTQAVKTAEDTLLLYQRKQEESRIEDALDRTRIANVTVSDAPRVPQTPSTSQRALILWAGLLGGLILGFGVAYALDWASPRFGSVRDVQNILDIPVLADVGASLD